MIHATGAAGALHVLRLTPGADPRTALRTWCTEQAVEAAAVVAAVGSLSTAVLRHAGSDTPSMLVEDLEVCALTGTLSRHGVHLHLVVSDREGRVSGGHMLDGCVVRTTLELVLQVIDGLVMRRLHDPATGYPELMVHTG
jgi:predicted DNA-binding protein with PD1-like motif